MGFSRPHPQTPLRHGSHGEVIMVRHAAAIGALKGVQERSLDLGHHAVVPLRSAPRQLRREGRRVKEKDGDTVLVQQVFLLRSVNVSSSHGPTYAVRHIILHSSRQLTHSYTYTTYAVPLLPRRPFPKAESTLAQGGAPPIRPLHCACLP